MSSSKIRVGFIGLNPYSQWASKAHLPALHLLADEFTITGVANSSSESAQRAAAALHIPHAFATPQDLVESPEVDLVVVTVKVPYHFDLVQAALQAGKHVYCEQPLGKDLAETQQLAALAAQKQVVAVVGTQLMVAPAIRYVAQLIQEGYVGRVLSTTLIGSGGNWGSETAANNYYLYDNANGATMLTIPLAHTLAGLTKVLGGVKQVKAQLSRNFSAVKLQETGELKPKTAADQILVLGTLKSGAPLSIHYRGGVSKATNLLWEINGTEGDIQVTGPLGHAQLVPLTIRGARGEQKELTPLVPPAALYGGLPDNPVVGNVAQLYRLVAADIRQNTRIAPSFADAVILAQLLTAIEQSAAN